MIDLLFGIIFALFQKNKFFQKHRILPLFHSSLKMLNYYSENPKEYIYSNSWLDLHHIHTNLSHKN